MDAISPRRLVNACAAFAAVLLTGTVGFHFLLGEGWVASFYRAVVTTTLTGLAIPPTGNAAMIFSVVLLLCGVAIFLYIAGAVVEIITRGVLSGAVAERRKRHLIEHLSDHVIICGFGRVGQAVAAEVESANRVCVVIEVNPEAAQAASERGLTVITGDGTSDEDLLRAGITRARALVACVDSDEKNVFITLSARALSPALFLVSRASSPQSADKLRRAGADRVVEPYATAGRAIATQVLRPQVAALLDVVGAGGSTSLRFEEIVVPDGCEACGQRLGALALRERTGASVVAVQRHDGRLVASPPADLELAPADIVVAMGSLTQIASLEEIFTPAVTHA